MIRYFALLLVVLLGIPNGFLLSRLCSDETQQWRKRLNVMNIVAVFLVLLLLFVPGPYSIAVISALLFQIVTNLTIILKTRVKRKASLR